MDDIEKKARELLETEYRREGHAGAMLMAGCLRDGETHGFEVELRAIIAALTPQWQPIETAPKDGRALLLCCMTPSKYSRHEPGFMAVCGYDEGWSAFNRFHFPPTHWQPLPAPPEML